MPNVPAELISIPNGVWLAAFITLGMGALEIIKSLINKRNGRNDSCIMSSHQKEEIHALFEMHNQHDEDGLPLWYVPRTTFKGIIDELKSANEKLDKVEKAIDKHDSNEVNSMSELCRKLDDVKHAINGRTQS